MRKAGAAVLVAVVAYIAWIPAVADNAHPVLATAAAVVFYGAVIALVVIMVRAVISRRSGTS